MREAGEPSTGGGAVSSKCARSPEAVMVAPQEAPHNALRAQSGGRAEEEAKSAAHGQYKGRDPVGPRPRWPCESKCARACPG
jgi:hypothetical protein